MTNREDSKEIKGIQFRKVLKLPLFADDMILYIENPENATAKALVLLSEYGKFSGYKIDTQKSLAFFFFFLIVVDFVIH